MTGCTNRCKHVPTPRRPPTAVASHPSNNMIDETGPLTPGTTLTLLEVSVPPFLEYGGSKYVEAECGSSSMPDLPAEFGQLFEAEQLVAKKEWRLTTRSNHYNFVTERWNPALHASDFSRWSAWFHILLRVSTTYVRRWRRSVEAGSHRHVQGIGRGRTRHDLPHLIRSR